ncbi:MAG TPA: LON peptidase substrate-binding domain-containing protein [Cryomorphaceae bacterium]|nr:LON peptidase substrate-binding domain-containing protein [Cryomorphaceae bacterium]
MQKTQLGLFPLQIFLLPGETTRLHIFEDRYRQLLQDCENASILFGIPYAQNGYLTGYGCVVKLSQVIERHANGSADIEIQAVQLFRIDQFYMRMGDKLYPGGDVEVIDDKSMGSISDNLTKRLDAYFLKKQGKINIELFSAQAGIFDVARSLKLSEAEKLSLVKAETAEKREQLIVNVLKLKEKLLEQENSIVGEIFLN